MGKLLVIFSGLLLIGISAGAMTGGWRKVKDISAPHIQKYAKFAVSELESSIDSPYHLKLMNISKAHQQVVAGMNYEFEFTMGPSECLRSNNYTEEEMDNCAPKQCDHPLVCNSRVWVREWLKDHPIKVTKALCEPFETFC